MYSFMIRCRLFLFFRVRIHPTACVHPSQDSLCKQLQNCPPNARYHVRQSALSSESLRVPLRVISYHVRLCVTQGSPPVRWAALRRPDDQLQRGRTEQDSSPLPRPSRHARPRGVHVSRRQTRPASPFEQPATTGLLVDSRSLYVLPSLLRVSGWCPRPCAPVGATWTTARRCRWFFGCPAALRVRAWIDVEAGKARAANRPGVFGGVG